jgi:hypothetical protein
MNAFNMVTLFLCIEQVEEIKREISNRFAALESLDDSFDINNA